MNVALVLMLMGLGLAVFAGGGSDEEPVVPEEPEEPDERPVTTLTDGDDEVELTGDDQVDGGQVLNAGAGDDRVFANEDVSGLEVFGEEGDDQLAVGNSIAHGGAGNDNLYIRGASGIGYGDAGDDTLRLSASSEGTLNGGDGDDSLSMGGGFGELNGDAGNDTIQLNEVGTANGGAGDDLIQALFFDNVTPEVLEEHGPVELTGGEGADTFGLVTTSATPAIVNITDFNPEEDFLVFAVPVNVDSPLGFDITVTQDPEADTTTVTLTRGGMGAAGAAVLAGMPDVAAEDVGLVGSLVDFEDAEPGRNFGIVRGTFGDDTLAGGSGDTVIGGNGDDEINVVQENSIASGVEAGAGNDVITASGAGVLDVVAGEGNDTVTVAGGGDAVVQGGQGDDVLSVTDAPAGAETDGSFLVRGGEGDDTITVGNGNYGSVVSLGDGDDVATVGEGVTVSLGGGGTDVVNVALTSAPADFPSLEAFSGDGVFGLFGSTSPTYVSNGGAQGTINIDVADPSVGSYHIIRSYFSFFNGPDAPEDVTFQNIVVWSADADADVNEIDFAALQGGASGFHVIALYDVGEGSFAQGEQVDNDTPSTPPPVVAFNFAVASVSAQLQGYLSGQGN